MFQVFSSSDLATEVCQWLQKKDIGSLSNCCLELSFTPYRCLFEKHHQIYVRQFYRCVLDYEWSYDRLCEPIKNKRNSILFTSKTSIAHSKLSLRYLKLSSFSFWYEKLPTLRELFVPFQYIRYISLSGNTSLSPDELPSNLRFLEISENAHFENYDFFPQHLCKIILNENTIDEKLFKYLPSSLEELVNLDRIMPGLLPSSLKKLTFCKKFTGVFSPGCLPEKLESLSFGYHCNMLPYYNGSYITYPFVAGVLPPSLTSLDLGGVGYNNELKCGVLPKSLTILHFSNTFNQALEPGVLNEGLKVLSFGYDFNKPLHNVDSKENTSSVLPSTLTTLTLGALFSHTLYTVDSFGVIRSVLPSSLLKLAILSRSITFLSEKNIFPTSLQQLWIIPGKYTYDALRQLSIKPSLLPTHIKFFNILYGQPENKDIKFANDFATKRKDIKIRFFNRINPQLETNENLVMEI